MERFKKILYYSSVILPLLSKITGFIKLLYNLQASNAEVLDAKKDILSSIKLLTSYYEEAKKQQDEFNRTV